MGFLDSSANLLFKIDADAKPAESELRQFRGIVKRDMAGVKGEFDQSTGKIAGGLGQFKAALAGVAVGLGAMAAAAGGALLAMAKKAADYAEAIEGANDKTGIAVEDLSKLKFAAESAGIDFKLLTNSLVLFESAVNDAQHGLKTQIEAFADIGITQKDLAGGMEDLLPLLYKVSDAFEAQSSVVRRTATARRLFGRGGAELVEWLSRGSDAMKLFAARAEDLGLVLTNKDIWAAKNFRLELQDLNAQLDAIWLSIGQEGIPLLSWFSKVLIAWGRTLKENWQAALVPISLPYLTPELLKNMDIVAEESRRRLQAALTRTGDRSPGKADEPERKAKKATHEFSALSGILDQVRERLVGFRSEQAQVYYDALRLSRQVRAAAEELKKLQAEGEITAEDFQREMAALGQLPGAIRELGETQLAELDKRRAEVEAKAAAERKRAADEARAAQKAAFLQSLQDLQREQAAILFWRMTTAERIRFLYDQDLEKFSEVEEAKTLAVAANEAERDAIRAQFALNRAAAEERFRADSQALANTLGFGGVFSREFGDAIRNNEELLRQWAESANQSLLMVQVAGESMAESLRRSFGTFANAMAANISQALIYRKSIGEAMRAAAAAAMQQLASESIAYAIYSAAMGFLRLALHDFPGAAAAFKAAALFGGVGAVAVVAGRAIAPRQGASSGAGGAAGTGEAFGGAGAAGGAPAQGDRVQIIIQGPIIGPSGIEELTEIINDHVANRDVRLLASEVKSGDAP